MALKSWREVIVPHSDVLEGTFQEAQFAADLTKVVRGIATPEYQDPIQFFERTVITEGMSLLLQSVVQRLASKGGDPVVQLQTAFGGGKTHTMMAVLHVASGKVPAKQMQGIPATLDKAGVTELVKAKVAVLDGNALSPSQPRPHGKISANTLWGELAWQLGGAEGYARVADSDRDGTSPGKEVLSELLEAHAPAIVLMDETVAYLRQFEHGKGYPGGTYNSNLSFVQALTEAAARVPNAMVLASLPESAMEVGDDLAQQALDALQKYFGRIEAVWKPVGSNESFEIVRRRLFGPIQDDAARDEVCQAFAELYQKGSDSFPAETHEGEYLRRLQRSYPIHPEVFARLYEDWSTLPKFQRTRGVLRLMARMVHSLWRSDNRDLLILPGSIPLDDQRVRNELVQNLPSGWDPIVDKEIDGLSAEPRRIDDGTPALGAIQACRRTARTIFLGSAPSVGSQKVRGIGVERIRLGCAQPGQAVGKYDDGLKRLSDHLHNLYSGNDRYWFDLRPNLRREMEDRMQRFDVQEHLYPEVQGRLQRYVRSNLFRAVHVFEDAKDIPDQVDLRLVVLNPDQVHKRKEMGSAAVVAAEAVLNKHGEQQRSHQNRLLFLAPDAGATQTLRDHVRRFLAWSSIKEDGDELNLDKHHEKEVEKSLDEASKRVDASLREAYRHLLAPMQDPEAKGGLTRTTWEDEPLSLSAATPYDRAIEAAVKEKEWVIRAWAPIHLSGVLQRWFWKDGQQSVGAEKVWVDFCKYLYLPRLASMDVFVATIEDGVKRDDYFGYAAGQTDDGFIGVLFGAAGKVYVDRSAALLNPALAKAEIAKLNQTKAPADPGPEPSGTRVGTPGKGSKVVRPPTGSGKLHRRFHGTVAIDPGDPNGAFSQIVEDVIEHFTVKLGTEVTISVDIEAKHKDGFDTKLVRIVRENGAMRKFKTAEFEED